MLMASRLVLPGPDVTLIDYAYDTTAALIKAGQTSVPVGEPPAMIPLTLGALVLGAAGIRRWRAAQARP